MSRKRTSVDERLALVLAVVPWLAEQGGATVDEIGARFSIDADEVMSVLSAVQCCEVPPYGGATIGIAVFDDGTVQVDPIVAFDRPLRFTADEAFGLVAAGRTALAVDGADADGALQRGLAKLEEQLGGGIVVDLEVPPLLDVIRAAVDERAQLRIDYYSASRDEATTRVVDPWSLRSVDGHWYLVGHCHRAEDRRVFRVDRIDHVEPTGERVPDDSVDPRPDEPIAPGAEATRGRIRMPADRRWLLETVVVDEVTEHGDTLEVVLPVGGRTFLEQLVVRAGPGAEVLEPADLVGVGREAAARLLSRYEG
ncbi:MAG: WYL domain-containing protein [Actinomycetota bacterium]